MIGPVGESVLDNGPGSQRGRRLPFQLLPLLRGQPPAQCEHVADQAVSGPEAAPDAAVEVGRPQAVVLASPHQLVGALLPGRQPARVACPLVHGVGSEHRSRRAPHDLVGVVVGVLGDALEERVRDLVVRRKLPGDGENARLTREQAGAGGGGELDALHEVRLCPPGRRTLRAASGEVEPALGVTAALEGAERPDDAGGAHVERSSAASASATSPTPRPAIARRRRRTRLRPRRCARSRRAPSPRPRAGRSAGRMLRADTARYSRPPRDRARALATAWASRSSSSGSGSNDGQLTGAVLRLRVASSQSASRGFRGSSGPWRYVPMALPRRHPSKPDSAVVSEAGYHPTER